MKVVAILANLIVYLFMAFTVVVTVLYKRAVKNPEVAYGPKVTAFVDKLPILYDKFYYSYSFPIFVALISLVSWFSGTAYVGISLFVILACPILFLRRDITPLYPLLFSCAMCFKDMSVASDITFYTMVAPVAVCLVYKFVKFPVKQFYLGGLIFPLILVTAALFTGGLLSPYLSQYTDGLTYAIPMGPVLAVIYILFSNYTEKNKNTNFKKYFLFSLVFAIMSGAIQLIYQRFNMFINHLPFETAHTQVGWGHFNTVGSIILLAVPACFYLMCHAKRIFPYLIAFGIFYGATFLSGSDGSLAALGVFTPVLLVFGYLKMDRNKKALYLKLLLIILLIVSIGLFVLSDKLNEFIAKILDAFIDDRGRTWLYNDAMNLFRKYPVFGGGLGYHNDIYYNAVNNTFNFHSTLFQVMGTMGIMGLVAYTVYFIARYKILTKKNTPYNLFAFLSFTLFTVYGFVDCMEFFLMPSLTMATLLIYSVEFLNEKDNDIPLPLYHKLVKF